MRREIVDAISGFLPDNELEDWLRRWQKNDKGSRALEETSMPAEENRQILCRTSVRRGLPLATCRVGRLCPISATTWRYESEDPTETAWEKLNRFTRTSPSLIASDTVQAS